MRSTFKVHFFPLKEQVNQLLTSLRIKAEPVTIQQHKQRWSPNSKTDTRNTNQTPN